MKKSSVADELKATTTACRVSFNWLGTRKTFTANEKATTANTFGADQKYVSASKKLFDTKHPAFSKLTSIKNNVTAYWKAFTLPYVEDGVRLLHRNRVDSFNEKMTEFKTEFSEAVEGMENSLYELKDEAKKRLGSLFQEENYPNSVKQHFGMEWDFPSIEPPEHLKELAPKVYEQERERLRARIEEAIVLAQSAFLVEFKELVSALQERLTPDSDGKKKVFKESTVNNLNEFFQRFKELHLGGNEELEKLIENAQELVKGIEPKELRQHDLLRAQIVAGLADLNDKIDPLVSKMPRRKIITPKKEVGNEKIPA